MNVQLWKTRFREHMEVRNWSPRTVASYSAELRPFFEFLEDRAVESISGITRDVVEEYRALLFVASHRGKRLSVNTQASRLGAVKAFVRYLAEAQFLLIDPGAQVDLPRVPRTLPRRLLSEAEVARLMEAPDTSETIGLRDRAALEVLYSSGLRNSELCDLTSQDINLTELELHVHDGKGSASRKVPLGEEAAHWLEAYVYRVRPQLVRDDDEARLFLTWRGRPFTRENLTILVARAAEAAGLAQRVTPHLLRHCCATHMMARGAGLRHIQNLLGHASVESTQRYTHIEISNLREVHRRCHPRENGGRRA